MVDSTRLRVTTGAHAAGAGDVVITTCGGTATLPGAFTFVAPIVAPVVAPVATPAAVDPAELAPTGGSFGSLFALGGVLVLSGVLLLVGGRRFHAFSGRRGGDGR